MRIALISKNKENFVKCTLSNPDVFGSLYYSRVQCNTVVLTWIHHFVIVLNLKTCFSISYVFRISNIQEELYKIIQVILDVSDYITQIRSYGMN